MEVVTVLVMLNIQYSLVCLQTEPIHVLFDEITTVGIIRSFSVVFGPHIF